VSHATYQIIGVTCSYAVDDYGYWVVFTDQGFDLLMQLQLSTGGLNAQRNDSAGVVVNHKVMFGIDAVFAVWGQLEDTSQSRFFLDFYDADLTKRIYTYFDPDLQLLEEYGAASLFRYTDTGTSYYQVAFCYKLSSALQLQISVLDEVEQVTDQHWAFDFGYLLTGSALTCLETKQPSQNEFHFLVTGLPVGVGSTQDLIIISLWGFEK